MKVRFTLAELLTAVVGLVVIAAIAVPMWRTHQLRIRRVDAADALRAVQSAQDEYFGKHARYADEAQLRTSAPQAMSGNALSARGYYRITLEKSDDELTYSAVARAVPLDDEIADTRCVELRIDQNGRRYAVDATGEDRSADCWR
ncbi:MAG TPA: type IV pilin protein [Steroidobacteraceae bacterium]|nr:type IV pilin protein [Steroidobacteraceae bacterium]